MNHQGLEKSLSGGVFKITWKFPSAHFSKMHATHSFFVRSTDVEKGKT